jgi:hypothetical protein
MANQSQTPVETPVETPVKILDRGCPGHRQTLMSRLIDILQSLIAGRKR